MVEQVVCVKVIVALEDVLDDGPPLLRDSLSPALQKFLEPLHWWQSDLDGFECEIVGHGWSGGGVCSESIMILKSHLQSGKPLSAQSYEGPSIRRNSTALPTR